MRLAEVLGYFGIKRAYCQNCQSELTLRGGRLATYSKKIYCSDACVVIAAERRREFSNHAIYAGMLEIQMAIKEGRLELYGKLERIVR